MISPNGPQQLKKSSRHAVPIWSRPILSVYWNARRHHRENSPLLGWSKLSKLFWRRQRWPYALTVQLLRCWAVASTVRTHKAEEAATLRDRATVFEKYELMPLALPGT